MTSTLATHVVPDTHWGTLKTKIHPVCNVLTILKCFCCCSHVVNKAFFFTCLDWKKCLGFLSIIYSHVKNLGHPIEIHGFLYQDIIIIIIIDSWQVLKSRKQSLRWTTPHDISHYVIVYLIKIKPKQKSYGWQSKDTFTVNIRINTLSNSQALLIKYLLINPCA